MNIESFPKIRYTNSCPSLPADRPSGFPRIVDLTSFDGYTDETDKAGLTGADGVATFLWNYDKAHFHSFFDLTQNEFKLNYWGPKGSVENMVIHRRGRTVTTGFRLGMGRGEIRWSPKLVLEIQQEDGYWKGKTGEMHAYQEISSDPQRIASFGEAFTACVLSNSLWDLEREEGRKVEVV